MAGEPCWPVCRRCAGLIADKAYDANNLRDFLIAEDIEPVISPNPRRPIRPPFDPTT